MKVFKTELNRPVKLKELMSGNPIVPEDVSETETEWELLERGVLADAKDRIRNDAQKAIIRRYEYYKYTGPYDAEHEPLSAFDSNIMVEPPAGELGNFISANMVAANLVPLPVIEGDYNDDGVVDAGDYLAWRKHLGSEVEVEVDGDHSGRVDDGDLGVWRQHYGGGQAGAGALVSGGAVPEPATLVLLLTALAFASIRRAHRAK
jgi:PEP-CTERM motif-containing protein